MEQLSLSKLMNGDTIKRIHEIKNGFIEETIMTPAERFRDWARSQDYNDEEDCVDTFRLNNLRKFFLVRIEPGGGLIKFLNRLESGIKEFSTIEESDSYKTFYWSEKRMDKESYKGLALPDYAECVNNHNADNRIVIVELTNSKNSHENASNEEILSLLNEYEYFFNRHKAVVVFALRYGNEKEFESVRELLVSRLIKVNALYVPSFTKEELWAWAKEFFEEMYGIKIGGKGHAGNKQVFMKRLSLQMSLNSYRSLRTVRAICEQMLHEMLMESDDMENYKLKPDRNDNPEIIPAGHFSIRGIPKIDSEEDR